MNEANYRMDYDDRMTYARDAALELLEDDDRFIDACDALDSWDGFLDDNRCYDMCDLDELLGSKAPSEILTMVTGDFDYNDDYFYFSIYGLESTNCKADLYRDCVSNEDVLDALISNYRVDVYDSDLDRIVDILRNDDYGIEEGWEYDENNWDGEDYTDEPEETDEEFMSRVDG